MPSGFSTGRVWRFLRAHLLWIPFCGVLMLVGTAVHECAHAITAIASGGVVDHIQLVPSFGPEGFRFGQVHFAEEWNVKLTSAMPAILSLALVLFAAPLVLRVRPGRRAELALLCLWLLPLCDLDLAVAGSFWDRPMSDLGQALPGRGVEVGLLFAAFLVWQLPRAYPYFLHAAGPTLSRVEFIILALGVLIPLQLRWAIASLAGA